MTYEEIEKIIPFDIDLAIKIVSGDEKRFKIIRPVPWCIWDGIEKFIAEDSGIYLFRMYKQFCKSPEIMGFNKKGEIVLCNFMASFGHGMSGSIIWKEDCDMVILPADVETSEKLECKNIK